MTYITIIGWIAASLTSIIGLPLVINTFLAKKPPKVSLLSWWIYYLGIFGFALLGFAIRDLQLFIPQVFSGLLTFIFLAQVYTFKAKTTRKQLINFTFLSWALTVFLLILLLGIFFWAKISLGNLASYALYLGIFAGFCVNIAFLPQTLLGIKNKTTKFIPLTFLLNLFLLNFAWLIYFFLLLVIEKNDAYLSSFIFQIIGFLVSAVQLVVYFYQIKQQKKPFKINWI
ncbi:hypothetical protein [Mesomycoplasma ovipneumoniae]|uniref:hypothetical protein n=1 Tax=Mesomycoplasma ovipneumoniae TaxID=29562 RepID=UPI00207A53EF|nr:hypothetical protein [Mesomycoplasma ovipneumoniae]MCN0158152.1 hypothetical protein [Mesomycoplasma ovipneumoniae]MDO6826348.1 hypothetical protein [Mesomycoplasma ovipneumoniae]MDO6857586.1 hypothetical protein [Mesomycoplasma ovipneumoniae]MDW2932245.1 hypothetical protein [Mesomycoplasma ovipneumoniae]WNM16233.1 hypothetical protein RNM19_02590 [Mesomycoplasma ovipneumoniae]